MPRHAACGLCCVFGGGAAAGKYAGQGRGILTHDHPERSLIPSSLVPSLFFTRGGEKESGQRPIPFMFHVVAHCQLKMTSRLQ